GQSAGGLAFGLAAFGQFVTQLDLALVDRAHLRCGLAGGGPVPGAGFGHAERLPRGRRRLLALLAVFVVGLRTVVVGCGLLVAAGLGRTFGRLLLAAALGRAAAREFVGDHALGFVGQRGRVRTDHPVQAFAVAARLPQP